MGSLLGSDKEKVMSGAVSRMRRAVAWGLAAGVVLLMAGDHAQTASPGNSAIDPFEILDLQVKPNVVILLDSSGSMRGFTAAATTVTGVSNGDLVGDDPNAKMSIAKSVLKTIVNNNKNKVNFQLGKYTGTNPAQDGTNNYLYRTTDANAATLAINSGGDGSSTPGISRNTANETVTIGGIKYYYVVARRFWNGETVNTSTLAVTPTTPTKTNPATVTLTNGTLSATFTLVGAAWNKGGGGTCTGFQSLVALAPCNQAAQTQVDNIEPYLGTEVAYNTDGSIVMNGAGTAPATTRPDGKPVGIKAGGLTPIGNSITTFRTNFWTGGANYWSTISAKTVDKRPKTILVFVTDGDDTCAGGTQDENARDSAKAAQDLYAPQSGSLNADGSFTDPINGPTSSVDTFFIAFGNAATQKFSDWIAWGGSGLNETAAGFDWDTDSDTTLQTKRDACVTCRDSVNASDASALERAIQDAINRGVGSGEFSSQSQGSVTDSVFEFVGKASVTGPPAKTFDPLDPITRFGSNFPITVRSTFQMPTFNGQLKAFTSASTTPIWDAGQVLKTNVLNVMGTTQWTFAQLHGGSSVAPTFIPSSSAKIRRRIFTTSRNGVNLGNVALWPPDTTNAGVAPSDTTTYPAGNLDGSAASNTGLAIGGLTFTELQTQFKACLGTNLPAHCLTTATAAQNLGRAMKEAREIILAYHAGAMVVPSGTGLKRNTSGELLYSARTWLLAESTIATPAIVGPPGELPTALHAKEWTLYTDGPRDLSNHLTASNPIENGFGLRNPDRLDPTASTGGEQEPVMTVVYVGANDMLHAFRAGPSACTSTTCPATGAEAGGEELWGFVPYDLLPVLKIKRQQQTRANAIYMISSSLRFGDVFVPCGSATCLSGLGDGLSYGGKWRTMMFFGRGPGGKYMTGMDITGPGPFTRKALETRLPDVVWNRGNPDTQDGTAGGTANSSTDLGDDDWTFTAGTPPTASGGYATMGETWSVPSLAPVDVTTSTSSDTFGKEWVLFMGSGFSDVSTEGKNFYTIDALTGDILRSVNIGSATGTGLRTNFLVAPVAGFVPNKLQFTTQVNAADGPATAAFVGDLHGRLFRFSTTDLSVSNLIRDFGTNQPIGVAVSALDLSDGTINKPHVYGVTGNDNRIFDPKSSIPPPATPPFLMFGLRDDGSSFTNLFSPTSTTGTLDFPERFRGTTQPLVARAEPFNVVFFIGTQFDPAGTSPDTTQDPCVSSFDTILFAVNADSGNAAYDLQTGATDDRSAIWRGQKVQNITARGGKVVLDTGLQAGSAPPPPPPPAPQSNSAYASVSTTATRYGSPVCKW
jgi:hypothetical protein